MKLKHRIMLWYAKRRAKKQTVKSGRQVAAAPRTAGTAAASGTTRAARATTSGGKRAARATTSGASTASRSVTGRNVGRDAGRNRRRGS